MIFNFIKSAKELFCRDNYGNATNVQDVITNLPKVTSDLSATNSAVIMASGAYKGSVQKFNKFTGFHSSSNNKHVLTIPHNTGLTAIALEITIGLTNNKLIKFILTGNTNSTQVEIISNATSFTPTALMTSSMITIGYLGGVAPSTSNAISFAHVTDLRRTANLGELTVS